MVVARIVRDAVARHRQCAATEVADSAATVITRTAGDGNVRQVRRTTLVGNTATVAAPAAFQRAVAQVQRRAAAHRDDLTVAQAVAVHISTASKVAIKREQSETCFDSAVREQARKDFNVNSFFLFIFCFLFLVIYILCFYCTKIKKNVCTAIVQTNFNGFSDDI